MRSGVSRRGSSVGVGLLHVVGVGDIGAGGTVRCLRTAQWTRASSDFKIYLGFL
jgi:hypothetical protein